MIYFITGNKGKLAEAQAILDDVEGIDIDLPEIQEIDPHKIIRKKIQAAFQHKTGQFIVEDTSLTFEALNELPGPLIKWFLIAIGNDGLAGLADKLRNNRAEAKVVVGFADSPDNIQFFEGDVKGTIVYPRGENGFGWDAIFLPDGYTKTFAEMNIEEKNAISMRKIALEKLRDFLTNNNQSL